MSSTYSLKKRGTAFVALLFVISLILAGLLSVTSARGHDLPPWDCPPGNVFWEYCTVTDTTYRVTTYRHVVIDSTVHEEHPPGQGEFLPPPEDGWTDGLAMGFKKGVWGIYVTDPNGVEVLWEERTSDSPTLVYRKPNEPWTYRREWLRASDAS